MKQILMNSRHIFIFLGSLVVLAGCDSTTLGNPSAAQLHLQKFSSCAEMDEARTYKGDRGGKDYAPLNGAPEAAADTASESGGSVQGETNLQVDGVDEMDHSKADGDYIYHLNAQKLKVIKRSPANQAEIVQTIVLPENTIGQGLYLMEGKAVVIATEYDDINCDQVYTGVEMMSVAPDFCASGHIVIKNYTRATDGTLSLEGTREIDGSYLSSRMIDHQLHLVISQNIPTKYEGNDDSVPPVETTLPTFQGANVTKSLANCTDVYAEKAALEQDLFALNTLSCVVSLDAEDKNAQPKATCMATNSASIVYASAKNMFVASYGWDSMPIHQFQLADSGDAAKYIGTAKVEGYLLNQFSMDEYQDYLRVAVTDTVGDEESCSGDGVDDVCSFTPGKSVNRVLTLALSDGDPSLQGSTDDLAEGEQIYSVRFLGTQAYVVTFRQVDPLFVIDLSDPELPAVKGELKVTGVSDYLHPIQEGYLLGVGRNFSESGTTQPGIAVSLFDVRDPSNPKLASKVSVGSGYSFSEVSYDHHAFKYVPEENLAVIPVQSEGSNGFFVIRVNTETGLSELGEVPVEQATRSFYQDGVLSFLGFSEFVNRNVSAITADVARFDL